MGADARPRSTACGSTPARPSAIAEQLGEDLGRLDGIVAVLRSTFGEGVRITASDVEPFLGDAGGVPPWDFTDAIDAGQTATALTMMSRMMNGGDRHPLQVMAILHGHYCKLARLDGVDARNEARGGRRRWGSSPGFPAKKALGNYQRLGRRRRETSDRACSPPPTSTCAVRPSSTPSW